MVITGLTRNQFAGLPARGFESRPLRQNRGVAQLVARLVRDQEVVGSNPVTPTISSIHKVLLVNTLFFILIRFYTEQAGPALF